MKLRLGFVTNSSSTNYVIMWRGDVETLKEFALANKDEIIENMIHEEYLDDILDNIDEEFDFEAELDFLCKEMVKEISKWKEENMSMISYTTYDGDFWCSQEISAIFNAICNINENVYFHCWDS